MKPGPFGLTLGFAAILVGLAAATPVRAQFAYPVIIVPPAQNLAAPKKTPMPPAQSTPKQSPPANPPGQIQCTYQGQTRICR